MEEFVERHEQEALALAAALDGLRDGIALLPEGSVWIGCLREIRTGLEAAVDRRRHERRYPAASALDSPES